MKRQHLLIALVIVLLALVGYHYYAAGVAADQIDEALQEQSQKAENHFTINYAGIDVHPFSGDINFHDLRFAQKEYQYDASLLSFDLTYLDFLRFYIGGTDFGLKNLTRSKITTVNPSTKVESIAREISADTLKMDYQGNMYDLLRSVITDQPVEHEHQLYTASRSVFLSEPGYNWGSLVLDSLTVESAIPVESRSFLDAEYIHAKAKQIQWIPPDALQEQYEFFIRGFGYQPDSVGIDSVEVDIRSGTIKNQKTMNASVHTDLLQLHSSASIRINYQNPGNSVFEEGRVNIPEISDRFNNFLKNSEQLFGIRLPQRRKNILQYDGPVTNPNIRWGGGGR